MLFGRTHARSPVLLEKAVDVLHKYPALQCVLQHLHEGPIARKKDRGSLASRVSKMVLIDELKAHQRLTRPWDSSDERKMEFLRLTRAVGCSD